MELKTDTLNSIFDPVNKESSSDDEYVSRSSRNQRSNKSENIYSSSDDCDNVVSRSELENISNPARESRNLKSNMSIDLIFSERTKEGVEGGNLEFKKRGRVKEESRQEVFLEPVLDNIETIDDIFG